MANEQLIPQEIARQRFTAAMQLYVGAGKRWSCVAVAEASGVALRTVESYRSGQALPTLDKYQTLISALGMSFFRATIEHLPYEVRSAEAQDITEHELMSEGAAFNAHLARMLVDGRIDHREAKELDALISDLQETLSGYQARKKGD